MKKLELQIEDNATRHALARIIQGTQRAGGRAVYVGGCVRDAILGLPSKDFDVEVYGLPAEVLKQILSSMFQVDVVGEAFGVLKIHGHPIDVSIPRRESKVGGGHKAFDILSDPSMTPNAAAARRDFTINAMAYDPVAKELLDPYGGYEDLHNKILRYVGPQFSEDPLRVLRGQQFAGRFLLQATSDTLNLCQELLGEYDTLAIERIWGEWYKWAAQSQQPSVGLTFLQECGWLQPYPELIALQQCPQDPRFHPEGDVWTHTLHVVDQTARIAKRDGLSAYDRAILVLSGLCHDLGKPECTEILSDRIRSHGHTETLETYRKFLQKIGAPADVMSRVMTLCKHHLTHIDFKGSARHVRRLAVKLEVDGETMDMLAKLVEADHSGRPPLPQELPDKMRAMLDLAQQLHVQDRAPQPLLMGRHLLGMDVPAGPRMGEMLKAAFEAQIEGEFDTLEDAKIWVQTRHLK